MAKEGELSFWPYIFADFEFYVGVTPLSHMTTIAVFVRLGMANIARKFITMDIVKEELRSSWGCIRMALQAGGFRLPLKTGWVSFSIAMEFRYPMAFHTFHLLFFPVDIRLISLHSSEIFHAHTSAMTSIAWLVNGRTFEELMSSKETTSSRSFPEDMTPPTGGMTFETGLIDGRFYRWPLFACPLLHDGIGSTECSMKTCTIGLKNLFMTGSAKTLNLHGNGRRLLSLMGHLLSRISVISAVAMNTAEPPMSRF
jgi:hypothetical protein